MVRRAYPGAAVLLALAAACSRRDPQEAALESAYKAGVLSQDEYSARKAAIEARSAKLAALDRARKAGLLTDDEYAARRAELLTSTAPPPSAASTDSAPRPQPVAAEQSAPAPTTPSTGPQSHSYRMKMAQIIDAQGFDHPIPSASMLIPVDWQSQGGTTWNIKDRCNGVQTHVIATGPGGLAFERFPQYNWVWADDPRALQAAAAQRAQMGARPCDVMAPMSAQEYLRRNLPKLRPNAQLVGFEPAPKLMQDIQQQAQQTEEGARRFNLKQQVKGDAIRARLKYTLDGRPMEEWIFAATMTVGTFGPLQQWSYNCVAYAGAQRAPEGQLEASVKLFELIASTFRVNPEWQARITQNALAMQQIELKGIRDRSAIVAKSAEDQRNIQRQAYENRQRVEDSTNANFSQIIRGVESFRNPATGETVELDANYGHAWVNNRGEYLLSDQANFDPNSAPGNTLNWTQLQQVKK